MIGADLPIRIRKQPLERVLTQTLDRVQRCPSRKSSYPELCYRSKTQYVIAADRVLCCLAGTKADPYCFQRKHRDGLIRLVIQAHPDSWRVSWRPVQIIPPNGLGLGRCVD